jgi:hypothetical protein
MAENFLDFKQVDPGFDQVGRVAVWLRIDPPYIYSR